MKKVKKRCELDIILHNLILGLTKKRIQNKLKLKPSALSNHLRRLEELGCIKRRGKYVIDILKKKVPSSQLYPKVYKNHPSPNMRKRGHAYNVKILFPEVKELKNNEVINQFKKGKLEKLKFGSYKFTYKKNTIWINTNSITVYSNNSYYSNDALRSKLGALRDFDLLCNYLKNRFGYKGTYGIEVFREHYGLIFNEFAEWLLSKGEKLDIKNKENKSILWVDDSRKDDIGLKEFETNDPLICNKASNNFDSHVRTNWEVTPEFTLTALNQLTKNLELSFKKIQMQDQEINNLKQSLTQTNKLSQNPPNAQLDINYGDYIR